MGRVIVTGGAGFIGSHLVDALIERNHRVTVVDNLSCGSHSNVHRRARLVVQDIRSPRLRQVWQKVKPQFVFHLAAQKNVRTSVEDPMFDADVNIAGSLNVIELSAKAKVKKFIFSSTGGAIYGDRVQLPTPETALPCPESPYGIAKYTIEQYLNFYRKYRNLNSISLRYANVYGPRQDPKGEAGVVAIFAQRLIQNKTLLINGTGNQTRDYVYVDDVVRANLLAIKLRNNSGQVNIGTAKQTSVNVLANAMNKIAGKKVNIKHRPTVAGEVMKSALSWKLANQQLHWEPKTRLSHGLRTTWTWAGEALV